MYTLKYLCICFYLVPKCNAFSLSVIQKTVNVNADLIITQCIFDMIAKFKEVKSINPKLKQSGKARELKISSATLLRYRKELNMPSSYRISNTHTRKQMSSDPDTTMTLSDLKVTSKDDYKADSKKVKSKKNLKGGDPIDINHSNGRDLIEQAFSSNYMGEFIEIKKTDPNIQKEISHTID